MKTMNTTLAVLGVAMLALTALPTASAGRIEVFCNIPGLVTTNSASTLDSLESTADTLVPDIAVDDLPAAPSAGESSASCSGGPLGCAGTVGQRIDCLGLWASCAVARLFGGC